MLGEDKHAFDHRVGVDRDCKLHALLLLQRQPTVSECAAEHSMVALAHSAAAADRPPGDDLICPRAEWIAAEQPQAHGTRVSE